MHAEDLKKLNEHFYDEVFGRRHVHAIDELLTDDFIDHTPPPGLAGDRQGAKDFIGQMLQAFPDLDLSISNQIAEGDMVAAVGTMTGTHQSEFLGIPATGRRISVTIMDTSRVRDGRFSEHWGLVDTSELMAQLGMTHPMR
jgi:steroid delta-isomerase-like uncharacterized protein